MKAVRLSLVFLMVCLALNVSAKAQFVQDPEDLGAADTIRMDFTVVPDAATSQLNVEMDMYFFADGQDLSSASFGFYWVNSNLQMTDAAFTSQALGWFDFIQFLYRNNNLDTTNFYQQFQCTAGRLFGTGMLASTEAQHIVDYNFVLSSWSDLDSLVFDTVRVQGAGFAFVDDNGKEYNPYFEGRIVIYDPNRPILSNLLLTEDTLYFSSIAGQAAPPPQLFQILSDQDPLSFDLTDDASWLLKSPSSGTTPQQIDVSVATTGLPAGAYFDSIIVNAPLADNSPQFLYVSLELAQALPTIGISRDEFFFNALAGGADPATQTLTITNTGASTLNWTVSNGQPWLNLSPPTGVNGGDVTLTVTTAGLTFGTYQDVIVVSDPAATNDPVEVAVQLSIASDLPVIEVDSTVNYFSVAVQEMPLFSREISVRNGGAGTLDYWIEESSERIWSVTPSSATAPSDVAILIYEVLGGLPSDPVPPYEIFEQVTIYSNDAINSPVVVDLHFRFETFPPEIVLSQTTLEFDVYECAQGASNELPSAQFTVSNVWQNDPIMIDIYHTSEAFEVIGGEVPQESPYTYTVQALLPDLPTGMYIDTIWVSSQWAINKPQPIEVTFNLLPTSETPLIVFGLSQVEIPWQEDTGPLVFDDLSIVNFHPGCMAWNLSAAADWLTPLTASGQVPDPVSLLVDPGGYTLGEYTTPLTCHSPTALNSPATLDCTLQVWKLRGDASWNGAITVQDVALMIDYVYNGLNQPEPTEVVGDVNCDEVVDLADIVLIVEYMFEGGDPLCGNPY